MSMIFRIFIYLGTYLLIKLLNSWLDFDFSTSKWPEKIEVACKYSDTANAHYSKGMTEWNLKIGLFGLNGFVHIIAVVNYCKKCMKDLIATKKQLFQPWFSSFFTKKSEFDYTELAKSWISLFPTTSAINPLYIS